MKVSVDEALKGFNVINHECNSWRRKADFFSLLLLILFSNLSYAARPDEGMYPVNMLNKVPLKKAGLRMSINDIYNPDGTALLQAVVQIGGCTGSFISNKGLIITNHHCIFGSLGPYSTPENNLLEKGYYAKDSSKELPIKGLSCKILESYMDESETILKDIDEIEDGVKKKTIIDANIRNIRESEQLKNPDLIIEVSEMLPGRSYILFRYRILKDIRIVYVPPRNVGEFGGESDNWEWPRHSGDFSLVRAYIGSDGNAVAYDKKNVPYHPQEFLNISAGGVNENDFVFVVGYPGKTFRNQPAEYIRYQQDHLLPFYANLFEWEINTINKLAENNPEYKIKTAPQVKSLNNTMKNYQGKLKALGRLDLYGEKKEKEQKIYDSLSDKPALQKQYALILKKTDSLYFLHDKIADKYYWYNQFYNSSPGIKIAMALEAFNRLYPTAKDKNAYANEITKLLRTSYKSRNNTFDSLFIGKLITNAANKNMADINQFLKPAKKPLTEEASIDYNFTNTHIFDSTFIFKMINEKPEKLLKLISIDAFVRLAKNMRLDYLATDSLQNVYQAQEDALLPEYTDIKIAAEGTQFIPDANRTLRLTYGYVKGYEPADGTYYQPISTVNGMIEKNGQSEDYVLNDSLAYLYKQHHPSRYFPEKEKEMPLCFLYNTDTTGGNSGSPVLNKYGQLVGINFDRSYEATVNDFAWNASYSRSIGVDIRFVLWYLNDVAGAGNLMGEMFVDK